MPLGPRTQTMPTLPYIQFWRPGHGPEDVLEELAWARDNDEEAQRIAVRGQELAAKYLTGKARTCYW